MSDHFAHGPSAVANRRGKAIDLAKWAHGLGVALPTEGKARRQAERDAGVRTASEETWALAEQLLAERLLWDRQHAPAGERFCDQLIGGGVCGRLGARAYLSGWCCPMHTPAGMRGHPETVPDPTRTLAALRVAAGRAPNQTTPLTDTLVDRSAIKSGKHRSTPARYREVRKQLEGS